MWYFRPKSPGEKIRNPIQGEFFATEAIEGPAQALVRESVQNSLDASSGAGPVRVQFTLVAGAAALSASSIAELFRPAWPHYAAEGNGLQDPPTSSSTCPYLLIEDYGTKGLTGDPTQSNPDPDPEVKNPFFHFYRAEGLSPKGGTELGRWGVGKFVFPRSSEASTHFGVTVRHDDARRLLLGASTLKAHRVAGDNTMYTPDGLYGAKHRDGFVLPIEDKTAIDRFCRLFGITRATEPGLSVVVPFVDAEITYERLLHAAVKDYFLPILNGNLEITIRDGASSITLTKITVDDAINQHPAVFGESVKALVTLARAATSAGPKTRIQLEMPDSTRAAKWAESLVTPEQMAALSQKLALREPFVVRVPITVRPKKNGAFQSYFDLYLLPDRNSDGRPVFLREGIIISDVRGRRARELRALVVIEDKPLATMLGDSENPAHTQWQRDSSNFRGKYTYGKAVIDFVTDSVGELLAIVNRSSEKADPSLTIDYFSIEPPDDDQSAEDTEERRPVPKKGPDAPVIEVPVEPRPTRIRIARSSGGFAIVPGSAPPAAPYLIEARCAYETRNGNPLKRWDPADFTLGRGGLPVACDGAVKVVRTSGNTVFLQVEGADFRASVGGFDVSRDLYVRAEVREATSADQEA